MNSKSTYNIILLVILSLIVIEIFFPLGTIISSLIGTSLMRLSSSIVLLILLPLAAVKSSLGDVYRWMYKELESEEFDN